MNSPPPNEPPPNRQRRIELPPMPPRIAQLPRDSRGYPIPWNVLRRASGERAGEPIFTVNDDRRAFRALRERLCPICGGPLGRWQWFTGGPRSAFDEHGWYLDLPGHRECAEYALAVCPYLSATKYLRRIDVPDMSGIGTPLLMDDTIDDNRPEVFVAVASPRAEASLRGAPDGLGRLVTPYVRPARPLTGWQVWRHGERLEREAAVAAVRSTMGAGWQPPDAEYG